MPLHGLAFVEDDDGWVVPECECGWIGPPCPDKEIAAEMYAQHCVDEVLKHGS